MKSRTERLGELISEIKTLFSDSPATITINLYSHGKNEVNFHGFGGNLEGTEFLRGLGIGERKKTVIDNPELWHVLEGEKDGITLQAFCKGLPQSCRTVVETVRVPKRQTVDTGEFIEIQQRKIICGEPKQEPAEAIQ